MAAGQYDEDVTEGDGIRQVTLWWQRGLGVVGQQHDRRTTEAGAR